MHAARRTNEVLHAVEPPPLKIDVVTGVALSDDACNPLRLGSSFRRSVEQLLHGPDVFNEALFWMLGTSFELPLDSGVVPRWQELFSEATAERV